MKIHKSITLSIDIMFVNKVPLFITLSRNLKFGTVEALSDQQVGTIVTRLKAVTKIYQHKGFKINTIIADQEFEPIRPWFLMLNICGANEHVPDIEQYIRTVKDWTRSTYQMLPFKSIPWIMLINLTKCRAMAECVPSHRWGIRQILATLSDDWM